MARYIPIQLKDALEQQETNTCYLVRVQSVQPGYSPYGVTNLDIDVLYDDGDGPILYLAPIGSDISAMQSVANMGVDNADAVSLMPEYDVPISESDIRAGVYDFAKFKVYQVNYKDLSQGHILLRSGTIGQVTIDQNGLSFATEFRGLSASLKQSICEKDSLSCRKTYGSQPAGSLIPGPVERFPCGRPAEDELVAFTVSAVGLENTLTFTASPFSLGVDDLNPGIVQWATGLNAGKQYEISSNTAGGEIMLAVETNFPIFVGDTGFYRPDCSKMARDTDKGCKAPHHWASEWPLHFGGEPDIPIGDSSALQTPGATSSPGEGGATYQPISEE